MIVFYVRHALTLSLLLIGLSICASAQAQSECPVTKAALVANGGSGQATGSLSQAFTIPPAYETITGRLRFLSDEWPEYFGTEYNDTYLAKLTAPGKITVLASGNVNSSSWSSGAGGFNGMTPPRTYTVELSGLSGKTAQLSYRVQDVGDKVVNSGLAVDAINVIRTEQFVTTGSAGVLSGPATISGIWGQVVKLTFKNVNALGTSLIIKDTSPFGESKSIILLPQQSTTFTFGRFGEEPMAWDFKVSTKANAFIVAYGVESTWTEGMPPNPCF